MRRENKWSSEAALIGAASPTLPRFRGGGLRVKDVVQRVSGCRVRFQYDDGALVATVSGLLTLVAIYEVRRLAAEQIAEHWVRVGVLDARAAALAMTARNWRRAAADAPIGHHRISVPVAYVVAPSQLDDVRAYCEQVSASGLVRVAFSDPDRAHAWASRRQYRRAPPSAALRERHAARRARLEAARAELLLVPV